MASDLIPTADLVTGTATVPVGTPEWCAATIARIESLTAQVAVMGEALERWKQNTTAFLAPRAVAYAEILGLPDGHLHPAHYDLLAESGARMDDFTRAAAKESS